MISLWLKSWVVDSKAEFLKDQVWIRGITQAVESYRRRAKRAEK